MKKTKVFIKYIAPVVIIVIFAIIALVVNRSKADEISTTSVAKASLSVKEIISCDNGAKVSEPVEVFVGNKVARTSPSSSTNLSMKNLPAGTQDGSPILNQFSFFGLDSKKYYSMMDDNCQEISFINMKVGDNSLDRMKLKQVSNEASAKSVSATTTPAPTLSTPQNAKVGDQIEVSINSAQRLDSSIIKWKDICDNTPLPPDGWKTLWAVKSDKDATKYTSGFTIPSLQNNCKIYFIADVSNEYAEVLVPENGLEDTNIPFLTVNQ